jgi:hypothetical protein
MTSHARLASIALCLFLAACGGQSSAQRTSTEPSTTEETTATRPVRIDGDEAATTGPTRLDVPAPTSTDEIALTSGELADPPPVEPP